MGTLATGLLRGALAGAAGTTALNATTYLDMALRGRVPAAPHPNRWSTMAHGGGVAAREFAREQVLGRRVAAHDLATDAEPANTSSGGGVPTGATVLATGIQDYPPGRSAGLALALRTRTPHPERDLALVHGVRGALHLHRSEDLGLLRAALRVEDVDDWAKPTIGPFGGDLAESGLTYAEALDQVAVAMRRVMADGVSRTKGELSTAVTPEVDRAVAPWCPGCGVFHVQDMLFRLATLQAALTVEVDHAVPSRFRFQQPGDPGHAVAAGAQARDTARAELVRRFLATCGPAKPAHLAAWLGFRAEAARRWWDLVADELAAVSVDGGRLWVHRDQLDLLEAAPARGVRLLPPYDPWLEVADREFLVPMTERRRRVWQAAANPGVLVVDGEVAGVWRQRRARNRLTVTVEAFETLTPARQRHVERDLDTIRTFHGAADATLRVD